MKYTILGCGGSNGVPEISCSCYVCSSSNTNSQRTRASIFVEAEDGRNLLIDTSPDLRLQALKHGLTQVDALLYTHAHYDHVAGMGDLKLLVQKNAPINAYMNQETGDYIEAAYDFLLHQKNPIYPALVQKNIIVPYQKFEANDFHIQSFLQYHQNMETLGFRIGNFAYSTDVNILPEQSLEILAGVEYWVVDCLQYSWAPTHSHLEQTISWIARVKPKLAILTHLNHEVCYYEMKKLLQTSLGVNSHSQIVPAYDGMSFVCTL
jgi:phosphoribosyl 1,2-cyclic phosphate phosphodiesterase